MIKRIAMGLVAMTTVSAEPAIRGGKSHFAKFETNKIHYVTLGKGRHTLVFVHGWAGNTGFWREQVPAVSDKAKLILIDLPGHGRSDKPWTDYTLDYFARGVIAVMRDARVNKATLIGHSMGVPVICRVYAQAPGKVAGLLAVDGFLRRPEFKPEEAEKFVAPFGKPEYRSYVTNFIQSMFPNPATRAVRDETVAEILTTPQHVMASAMEQMFDSRQADWKLQSLSVPVLILNAPNPFWTPEYVAYARALSPKTDYRVIEGTGHFLMLEKPAAFNEALVSMLRKFGLVDP
jgi:sigma-B regulation protein RsbQ